MREQATDKYLRVAYQLFVLQVQDLSGQHFIPVLHEAKVAAVVPSEILEVVAEGLALGEVLLVGAEARIHRVTAHVDDDGLRQDGMDEPDVAEIVRHLVDKVRPPRTYGTRLVEVAPAEGCEVLRRDATHALGITVALGAAMIELAHHRDDVGQLHRPFDFRVTGEYLLDESRAGSGQTDDENGRGIGDPGARSCTEEGGVEAGGHSARLGFEFCNVEGRCDPAQPIASRVIDESVRILHPLLKCASERKVQLGSVALIDGRTRKELLHGRDLGVGKGVGLEVSKTPVRLATAGVHPQTLVVGLLAARAVPQGFVKMADRQTQPHLRRIKPRRLFIGRERVSLAQQARVHRSERDPVLRIFGLHVQ